MDDTTFEDFCHNLNAITAEFREYVQRHTGTLDPRADVKWEELFTDFVTELWPPTDDLDDLPF